MAKRKRDRMTNAEFAAKIENEGGFYDAACYGIKADELEDETVAELWSEYCSLFEQMQALEDELQIILEGEGEEEGLDDEDEDDDLEEWEDDDDDR